MGNYIIEPLEFTLYEIVKIRVILLYKRYEVTLDIEGEKTLYVVELNYPQVGDYICLDDKNILSKHIKKEDMKFFKKAKHE